MNIRNALEKRILLCDGAMGSCIQEFTLSLQEDYHGYENCHEILSQTRPDVIGKIHQSYLEAGADIIETNTFGANKIVLSEFGLEGQVYELNRQAAIIARNKANEFSNVQKKRYVAGSVGPGTKLPSLGQVSFQELYDSYSEAIAGLIAGGVDLILIETCQDPLQAKAAAIAAIDKRSAINKDIPIFVQVTMETSGTMLVGSDIESIITTFSSLQVDGLGLNCATGPKQMREFIHHLSNNWKGFISMQPNAGIPIINNDTVSYPEDPQAFGINIHDLLKEFRLNIVGGCCGTTAKHISELALLLEQQKVKPVKISSAPVAFSSLYTSTEVSHDCSVFIVGERINASGSKKCRELLKAKEIDGIASLAKQQIAEGAHMLDVNVAIVGEDENLLMSSVIERLVKESTVPLMIDSSDEITIEKALSLIPGRAVVNSINFEDGGKKLEKICTLCDRFGAGVVALTIDEQGMARECDQKVEIAQRLVDVATKKFNLPANSIFIDPLTFSLATGNPEDRNLGKETLNAIEKIRTQLPSVQVVLGLSNISFGLDSYSRKILNTVFLHETMKKGLTSAILHAGKIERLDAIEPEKIECAQDLIYNKRDDALQRYLSICSNVEQKKKVSVQKILTIEERLQQNIIDANCEGLDDSLKEALKRYSALEIINTILLKGMKIVGERFGEGTLQLPFVLQSAEVMKQSVSLLEPFMEKNEVMSRGSLLLATVQGDVHDIGKNLVDIILTHNGYKVYNIGIKQSVEQILEAVHKYQPDAIGLSGLLVKSVMIMGDNLDVFNKDKLNIPVLLGGAALDAAFVENELSKRYSSKVYYCKDAFSGLLVMEELLKNKDAASDKNQKSDLEVAHTKEIVFPVQETTMKSNFDYGDLKTPEPPFFGVKTIENVKIKEVIPFINTKALFGLQWQYLPKQMPQEEYQQLLRDKVEPVFEKLNQQVLDETILQPKIVYGYFSCQSEGDAVKIYSDHNDDTVLKTLQFPRQNTAPFLCVSDFFKKRECGKRDIIPFITATCGPVISEVESALEHEGKYADYFHLHGYGVCFAEALLEYWHKKIRSELQIDSDGSPSIDGYSQNNYRGIRLSFGYPACPDMVNQRAIFSLLSPEKIGITLSSSNMMVPEQSASAFICHHPRACYFHV